MTDILGVAAVADGVPGGQVRVREISAGEYAAEVSITDSATNSGLFFSTDNEMMISSRTSVLRGETTGAQIDTSTWATSGTTGTVTSVRGELVLSTNAVSNGYAALFTQKIARHYPGTTGYFIGVIRLGDSGVANNTRRWGYYTWNVANTPLSGFFFELNGTTFSICYASNGAVTRIPWASCNGVTSNFSPPTDLVNGNQFSIIHGGLSCRWQINGRTVHTIGANNPATSSGPLSDALSLPCAIENVNTAGASTTATLATRGLSYSRLSPANTVSKYTHVTAAGTVLVASLPARLIAVNVNGCTAGGTLTVLDANGTSSAAIAVITIPVNTVPFTVPYGCETQYGLAYTASAAMDMTFIYE